MTRESTFCNPQRVKDYSKPRDNRVSWSKLSDAERLLLRKLEVKLGSADRARYELRTGMATFTSLRDGLTVKAPTLARLRETMYRVCREHGIVSG